MPEGGNDNPDYEYGYWLVIPQIASTYRFGISTLHTTYCLLIGDSDSNEYDGKCAEGGRI